MNNQTALETYEVQSPILLIVFNKVSTTEKVFNEIKKHKPKQLFIAADGPRPEKSSDIEKCQKVKEIFNNIDWECEVKYLYHEQNLGCKTAVVTAVNWFFENVEYGIILEDDCLPSNSFFRYCDELLVKYKDDMRVGMISGNQHKREDNGYIPEQQSYTFSYGGINGWASWRRAWKIYDIKIEIWKDPYIKELLKNFYGTEYQHIFKNYSLILDQCYDNQIDGWDYQWCFCQIINSMLSITPSKNLVTNIGLIDPEATHYMPDFVPLPLNELDFPLVHPNFVRCDDVYHHIVWPPKPTKKKGL